MSLPKTLRDFAIFNQGVFVGDGEQATLPKLTYKTDDWIGGGMSGAVKIRDHLEPLSCEWSAKGFNMDALTQMGSENLGSVGLRFVGAFQSPETGEVDQIEVSMRGNHNEVDGGEFKRGEMGMTKIKSDLVSYAVSINGVEKVFIDLINGIERYEGTDIKSNVRQALGI